MALVVLGGPLGPATSLVLLGAGLLVALLAAGAVIAGHPRRGVRGAQERGPDPAPGRQAEPSGSPPVYVRSPSGLVADELGRSGLRRYLRRRFDPAEATGLALTVALGLIFVAALAFGQLADMVTSRTGLYRLDAGAADWGARHATPLSTAVLGAFTWLGSTLVVIGLALAAGLYEWYRRRRWTVLAFMLAVIWGQNIIANGIKLLLHRERPPVPHLAGSSGWSFPSGHSASAAATYAALALLIGRGRRWPVKAWLGTAAAGVVVLVAASRVLLGVHWLTDVIAGVALGLGWFAVCSIAFGGTMLRFGATAERAKIVAARDDWRPPGSAV